MRADRERVTRMLKTAKGQLEGLLKMVEENRYCIDISNQLMATQAILRRVNSEVLRAHLNGCVRDAFETGDRSEKIAEITDIIDKLSK